MNPSTSDDTEPHGRSSADWIVPVRRNWGVYVNDDRVELEVTVEKRGDGYQLRVPLDQGGDAFVGHVPGHVEGDALVVPVMGQLAESLLFYEGKRILVNNDEGRFHIYPRWTYITGPVEAEDGQLMLRIPMGAGGRAFAPYGEGHTWEEDGHLVVPVSPELAQELGIGEGSLVDVDNVDCRINIRRHDESD